MVAKEDDFETFQTPESVYFALRYRSELIKLVEDKVVFCLYNHEKTMQKIKEGIDDMIDMHYNFRTKEKKEDAEIVRNYIVGIPPENADYLYYNNWR